MNFEINKSIEILSRTPMVLESLLIGISKEWQTNTEGKDTWSPYDIVGHLIHGEKTDWVQRSKIILSDLNDKSFIPFDRFAQMNTNIALPLNSLLAEFKKLRELNIKELKSFQINESDLAKVGIHPEFGKVNLKQLLSTWVVHDLGHIAQISRVMAKQYKTEVGPWSNYLGILR